MGFHLGLQRYLMQQLAHQLADTSCDPQMLAVSSNLNAFIRPIFRHLRRLGGARMAFIEQGDLTINLVLKCSPAFNIQLLLAQIIPQLTQQIIQLIRLPLGRQTGAHEHALKHVTFGLPLFFLAF